MLALLLSFTMMVGMIPAAAFGEDTIQRSAQDVEQSQVSDEGVQADFDESHDSNISQQGQISSEEQSPYDVAADDSTANAVDEAYTSDEGYVAYDGQTETGKYSISNAAQLVTLSQKVQEGTTYAGSDFRMENDIDLSEVCGPDIGGKQIFWQPIGIYSLRRPADCKPFSGNFHGNGKTVSGLYGAEVTTSGIGYEVREYFGLFGYIAESTVDNIVVRGSVSTLVNYSSGIVAYAEKSTINNCASYVNFQAGGVEIGGICCYANQTTIENCDNYANFNGPNGEVCTSAGGICYSASECTISKCKNYSSFAEGSKNSAGICHSAGNDSKYEPTHILDCENIGDINSGDNSGSGIVLKSYAPVDIMRCSNIGNITCSAGNAAGIICGMFSGGTISDCTNSGDIVNSGTNAQDGTAGIVAYMVSSKSTATASMEGCVNSGNVKGYNYVGGLAGKVAVATYNISGCYNAGAISCLDTTGLTVSSAYIGGLAGSLGGKTGNTSAAVVESCFNLGDVSGTTSTYVGGLAGYVSIPGGNNAKKSGRTHTIRNCFSAGSVSGASDAGGLFGAIKYTQFNSTLNFSNCYSSGIVTSEGTAGLAVGSASDTKAVQSCNVANISNVFGRESGVMQGIGKVGETAAVISDSDVTAMASADMMDESFATMLGGAFGMWQEGDHNAELFSDYPYPVLKAFSGAEASETVNVRVSNAGWFTCRLNGHETYATAVASGGRVEIELESDYPDAPYNVRLTAVKSGGNALSADADGKYVLDGVTADATVEVEYSYDSLPEVVTPETTFAVVLNAVDGTTGEKLEGATVEIEGYEPADGKYSLPVGSFPVNASLSGYAAVEGTIDVEASFDRESDNVLTVKIYPEGASKHTVRVSSSVNDKDWYPTILSGDVRIASGDGNSVLEDSSTLGSWASYGVYVSDFELYDGDYIYECFGYDGANAAGNAANGGYAGKSIGSGPLKVSGDELVRLRFVQFYNAMTEKAGYSSNEAESLYTMEVKSSDGTVYTPGSSDPKDGKRCGMYVLPAVGDDVSYSYRFIPAREGDWIASSGTMYVYPYNQNKSYNGLTQTSDSRRFYICSKGEMTLTVPEGSEVKLWHMVKFYEPVEMLEPDSITSNGDGSMTVRYTVPVGTNIQYSVSLDGYVKYCDIIRNAEASQSVTLTKDDLYPDAGVDLHGNRDGSESKVGYYDADIVMNVPDSKYVELESGEDFELYLFRNWQAIGSGTENDYVDPDYIVEVISGDSVEVTDPYYAGATLHAREDASGVSLVRVTYGPVEYRGTVYSKLWERNTAVIAVNVGGGAGSIDTGIAQQEFETAYFARSVNGVERPEGEQAYELTFTPTCGEGSTAAITKVSVHDPVGSDDAWDDSAWTELEASDDGSYTVAIPEGRSMVRVEASDGSVAYRSVRAAGVDMTVGDGTAKTFYSDGGFTVAVPEGQDAVVDFDGLQMPWPKLGAIYNPGFPSETYVSYTLTGSDGEAVADPDGLDRWTGIHSQYQVAEKNAVTLSGLSMGVYSLGDGHIHTNMFGSDPNDGHRNITKGGKVGATNQDSGGNSPEWDLGLLCEMPELKIAVQDDAAAEAEELIGKIGNVTLESGDAIEAARKAYDALTDAEKAAVVSSQTLADAEAEYSELLSNANLQDVADVTGAILALDWTVPMEEANDLESVKAWVEQKLAGIDQKGCKVEFEVTSVGPAVAGAEGAEAGTAGSFAVSFKVSKGEGADAASRDASVRGTIVQTAWSQSDTPGGSSQSGKGGKMAKTGDAAGFVLVGVACALGAGIGAVAIAGRRRRAADAAARGRHAR